MKKREMSIKEQLVILTQGSKSENFLKKILQHVLCSLLIWFYIQEKIIYLSGIYYLLTYHVETCKRKPERRRPRPAGPQEGLKILGILSGGLESINPRHFEGESFASIFGKIWVPLAPLLFRSDGPVLCETQSYVIKSAP